ncbi:MAG: hypothetical protein Q4G16_02935 [Cruoricaptor ignavus]|nr:hypothetical protein [Cruoricaptor ignavus]
MKKLIVYFFIAIYFFSSSEVRQVMKLPYLVEHYVSHKLQDEGTTLFSFIKQHYLEEQHKGGDYEQDMKLPFKTQDISAFSFANTLLPEKLDMKFRRLAFYSDKKSSFYYAIHFYPSIYQKVWQPPKI